MSSPVVDRESPRTPKEKAGRSSRRSVIHEERSPTSFKPSRDRTKRSEALIGDQVLLVKDIQGALQKALKNLERESEGDYERSEEELQALLDRSQKLLVMVQVMMKIRNELAYSRLELEKAIKADYGIENAKKRVKWLQQRLEKVLTTTRTCTQSRAKSQTKAVKREQISDHLWNRLSASQQKRLFEQNEDKDEYYDDRVISVIEDFAKMVPEPTPPRQDSVDVSPDTKLQSPAPVTDQRESATKEQTSLTKPKGSKKKKKRRSDPARVAGPSQKSLMRTVTPTDEELYGGEGDSTPEPTSEAEDDDGMTVSIISSVGVGRKVLLEEELEEVLGKVAPSAESKTTDASSVDRSKTVQENESRELPVKDKEQDQKQAVDEGIGDTEKDAAEEEDQGGEDEAQQYWEMDHHRFEWSDYMQELDPRSWHALGLSVQDSFLVKEKPQFVADLPWKEKPMKVNSVIDVHKIALDKLLVRLHRMYDAIGRATQATIDPLPKDEKMETVMGKLDIEVGTPVDGRPLTDIMAAYDSGPVSRDFVLPPLPGTANQKSVSFVERYPLSSEPSMIRIARKSSDKLYPRQSGVWCEDVSGGHDMPRLVKTKPVIHKRTSNVQSRYLGKKAAPVESPTWTERSESVWKPIMLKKIIGAVKKMASDETSRTLKSGYVDYTGPKWRRIQVLLSEEGLRSSNPTIAMEAAKSIGQLNCRDSEVITALGDTIATHSDARVGYESSKSMILLGTWSPHAMRVVIENIKKGNRHVVAELLHTMTKAKNIPFVDKSTPEFRSMVQLLVFLIKYKSFDVAFNAAISLGRLCVVEPVSKLFLINKLPSIPAERKSEALYVLIKQMNCKERVVLEALMDHLSSSFNWKHRLEAADLIIFTGARDVFKVLTQDEVFDVLENLLWDHANKELRQKISEVLGALGLRQRACSLALRRLEDHDERVRGRAVVSLATLGMKGVKEMKALLDILELDSSVYVRLQVVRAFNHLEWSDPRILRSLRERERGEGILASEAGKALTHLAEVAK